MVANFEDKTFVVSCMTDDLNREFFVVPLFTRQQWFGCKQLHADSPYVPHIFDFIQIHHFRIIAQFF
jgi:hypothetical protein